MLPEQAMPVEKGVRHRSYMLPEQAMTECKLGMMRSKQLTQGRLVTTTGQEGTKVSHAAGAKQCLRFCGILALAGRSAGSVIESERNDQEIEKLSAENQSQTSARAAPRNGMEITRDTKRTCRRQHLSKSASALDADVPVTYSRMKHSGNTRTIAR